ncbi:unnamed protein product [Mycetohabitans rhizoxinica HKI 454]|uniref:Uncharacterized protein n=1 Tax=Mycetohabitans rhizoxinica (strain DSM 19002 / CIP 109453 / HKI 454) TaxID=882378 RepID=E5ATC4_MYCRK|nr:unnamed protein product [Mycetohabitans rhizoxinica HKI 454]
MSGRPEAVTLGAPSVSIILYNQVYAPNKTSKWQLLRNWRNSPGWGKQIFQIGRTAARRMRVDAQRPWGLPTCRFFPDTIPFSCRIY